MKKVYEYIKQNNLLEKNDLLILGVSGGADSVCLLYILKELKEEYALNITAVHINHMIRETADRDEAFTKELCEKLDIKFVSYKTDCPAISERDGISLEEAGRNERYRLFNETGEAEYGKDKFKIAVAHHMDDLSETLVFNMSRGTGINGLAGVKCRNRNIIRPLLCVTRAEIEEYLCEKGVTFVNDETNFSDDYARNKIRHKIIPTMNEITEKAVNHMASCATQLGEIEDYLKIQTNLLWAKYVKENKTAEDMEIFISDTVLSEHPALIKRIIHRALTIVAGRARDISAVHIEAVLNLFELQTGRKRDIIYNMEAQRVYEGVRIAVKKEVSEEDKQNILGKLTFEIKDRDFSQNIPNDLYTKWFDYDKIKYSLNVRFRKEGDYLTVNSENARKLLSDYMTNEKIPSTERDCIPLLADGDHILWAVGYRISNYYKVTDETKKIIVATYNI
ncbi:MAG: tRNA lysidine(34) synthetase TilS [Lachnospiraceae bacterium]|nr:tRNA lysidine(34) synthetase TilS [Lachnospiraceae bacterium]